MNKKPLALAVSLALAALATQPAQASGTSNWIGTDGWWNDGANWNTGRQPPNYEQVWLIQSDAINRTVTYANTAYPSAVLNGLYISAGGSGMMTLLQTQDALSVNTETVGWWGTGTITQSGGTHTVTGSQTLGSISGSSGIYNLSNIGSFSAASSIIGLDGNGTFTQSGGTNTVAGTLTLGSNSGSSGTYNLEGGTLNVGTIVRGAGTSTFNWTGGTINFGTLTIGNNGPFGPAFSFDPSKSLSAANLSIDATGIFNHTSGTNTISNQMAINGVANLDGGSLNVGSINGGGTLNLNGGTLSVGGGNGSINVGNLVLGKTLGSNVSYTLSSTGFFDGANKVANALTVSNLMLGESGSAAFTQSGGTNTVAGTLTLGSNSDSSGTYNLDGGTLNVGTIVRGAGTSIFNWGAGTLNYGDLSIGSEGFFGSTFTLEANKSFSAANLTIDANGIFNHTSGIHTIANQMAINGISNLDGGTLNVSTIGGTGTLNLAGGTLNASTIGGISTLNLAGGTLNASTIGGISTLNLDGGALSVGGSIDVDTLALGKAAGANVSYTSSAAGLYQGTQKVASALTLRNLVLGGAGTGNFTQNGSLSLDTLTVNKGTLKMAAGTLTVGNSLVNHGTLALTGSTVAGATITQGATGVLSGYGVVGNDISSAGTVNAKSGNLILMGNAFASTGLLKNSVGSNLFIEAASVNNQGNIEVNSAGAVVFDAAISNVSGKTVQLNGGTLATPTLTNAAGGSVRGFGTLSGNLTNAGSVEFYGPTNIVGDVLNQSGGTILVRNNQTLITGHTVNDGTIQTLQGTVIFEGGLTNNGAYLSDPSDNYFTGLTVGQTGYLVGEIGDNFLVSGNFVNNSTQNTLWNTSAASLTLTGLALQNMYLAGDDLGALASGYNSNYAWGEFSLVLGASVKLWDGNGDPGAALYVGLVELGGGLSQLSSIDSPYNIYYDASLVGNAYLGGQSYALNGGGYLMAAQPVPEAETYAMMLAGLGLIGGMVSRRRRAFIK